MTTHHTSVLIIGAGPAGYTAGMGCMAALEAEKFLAEHSSDPKVRREERQEAEMIGAYD